MAGPIRIAILANAIQAKKEMLSTARAAKSMGKDVEKSGKGFDLLNKAGSRVGTQIKGVAGVLAGAAGVIGQVASAGLTAAPALIAVGTAVFQVAKAAGGAAPALAAIGAGALFVKLTMTQLAPAIGKALTPITKAFQKAGAAAGDLAAKGVRPLAAAFAKVGIPIVSAAMNRIAVSTNKVVKGFLNWAKSTPGLTALRNITGSTATAFEKVAPSVQRLGIALASMIGRISGVSLAAGSKGLTGVLDFLTAKLNGITAATVSAGLNKLKSTFDSIRDAVVRVRDVVTVAVKLFRQYRTEIMLLADVFAVLTIVFGGPVAAIVAAVGLIVRHLEQVKAAVAQARAVFSQPGSTAFIDNIRTAVSTVWPVVKAAFDQIKAAVVPVITEIWTKIRTQLVPALGEFIAAAAPVVAFFVKQFVPILVTAFKTVAQVISAAVTIITGILKVFTGVLRGDWSKVWEGIKQITRGAASAVKAIISGLLKNVLALFRSAGSSIKGIWNAALALVKSAASSAWSSVKSGVASLVSSVTGQFNQLKSAISSRINSAVSTIKAAVGRIRSAFSGVNLFSAGAKIIQSLIDGISSRVGAVIGKINSVAQTIRDHFPFSPAKRGPLKRKPMTKAGKNIVRDLAAGMSDAGRVRAASSGLASIISGGASVSLTGNGRVGATSAPIVVNFNGLVTDPAAAGREVEKVLNKYRSLNGRAAVA